ncbi:transcriptional regulator, TetR family [Hoeflea sp. IMCC20628]|uniref:TetR/AcrR family transcriptional regulator n=1 Tax=Hoeflea sp. IMCC20628 TaxID=1620421 RepID=UPI00063AD96E|nr:TetR/AcrR family transcriptional regulator [Hoeflea sp. IMCC20628]AKI01097.1 transcriptional regulator, TetR family [Hoeflea sp. IMCC20628]
MTDTLAETVPTPQNARDKLLTAGLAVIRSKGYSGTTVDELCTTAGVTKGAFFHHFKSKEALGVAAADYWSEFTGELFASAPYHDHPDPLDRVLGYIDFRRLLLAGELPDYSCLVGTMVQETYLTAPAIRDACHAAIAGHADTLAPDIQAAMDARGMSDAGWTAESLALHTQVVLQGAFILAKAEDSVSVAIDSVAHLKRYVTLLFSQPEEKAA